MALTSKTTFDIDGQTQTISFYAGSNLVDEITFSNNQITFAKTGQFTLSKSDTLLYMQFLNTYHNHLLSHFPSISSSIGAKLPLCQFDINILSQGVTKIIYKQTSQGNPVYTTNYVPSSQSASFAERTQMTITLQEFFMTILMNAQFKTQIFLN